MSLLPYVEVVTGSEPGASVIWLHGLGADGHDFEPIVPELKLSQKHAVRFIFPHAPKIPVTINGGMVMPAWYDILDMNINRKVDNVQLQASADAVIALVEQELARGIPSEQIFLAGFSQGGAVAYQAALSYDKPLGGLLTMSTYLATADTLELHPQNRNIPVMVMHGTEDPVVPEQLGQAASAFLQKHDYSYQYHTYRMPHSVCAEQIADISAWLQPKLK
ncbi:dienelactone hydrolase family protein [Thalassomonas viridans]|uniref:Dienelactone hydrolase family protein n=1 Tax=Thalassomonas viridans TaxID=137584 RepID=A0AAE9Z4H4_9GAMM|nr:dienelactone hydrolase family protein [Thalassomonas viridans]WDE06606.1 dienelactone hydrolase family protein [Thalassomonas viridans]